MKLHLRSSTCAAVIAALACPALAFADEPPPPQPQAPSAHTPWVEPMTAANAPRQPLLQDPVAGAAVANLVLGGLFLGVGATTWGTARSSDDVCAKLAGCFESLVINDEQRDWGAAITGAGLGFAAVGGITLAIVATNPKKALDMRDKPAVASMGLVFTGLALGGLVGGLVDGAAAEADGAYDGYGAAWPWFFTSGVAAVIGLPMIGAGARFTTAEERTKRRLRGALPYGVSAIPTSVLVGPGGVRASWAF